MIIGERLRGFREEKKLSQGDIEQQHWFATLLLSRVENGHTVPSVETLEKFARALEVPMYQLFYDGENPPELPKPIKKTDETLWGNSGKDERFVKKPRRLLGKSNDESRKLIR